MSAQNGQITIRLRSKDALERIVANRCWNVYHLKEEIAKKTNVPVADQMLATDQAFTQILSDATTLEKFQNGEMLHFKYSTERNLPDPVEKKEPKKYSLKTYFDHLEDQGLIFTYQKEAHCKEAVLDFNSVNMFQEYVQSFGFQRQRIGYLYGKYNLEKASVLVEAVYEPPQESVGNDYTIHKDDPSIARADALATLLGLQRVGWVFSHGPREYILNSREIITASELQAKALRDDPERGKLFVTLKLGANADGQGEVEVFQMSDQAVKLYDKGLMAEVHEDDPTFVYTREKVLMHKEKSGRIDAEKIDADVLLTTVAVAAGEGSLSSGFPPANRPEAPQTQNSLHMYLQSRRDQPWHRKLADFHLLLFLSDLLSMTSDMPYLCEAVKNKTQVNQGFVEIIESFAGM